MNILAFFVGLLTGVISGFGIGGGSLLIQYIAGGINLLYFICCAPAALISHIRNHLVEKKAVILCTLAGILTSLGAAWLASVIHVDLLRRIFGVLLLYIGVQELFCKKPEKEDSKPKKEGTAA